jgi:hypothetical protein
MDPKRNRPDLVVDWLNSKLGEWTIVEDLGWKEQTPSEKKNRTRLRLWKAKCSCGNTTNYNSNYLKRLKEKAEDQKKGETKYKLNCQNHPSHVMPCKVGDRIGHLEVISFPLNDGQKNERNRGRKYRNKLIKPKNSYKDKWLVGCLCHACGNYTKDIPYVTTAEQWRKRIKRTEEDPEALSSCGCKSGSYKHGYSKRENGNKRNKIYTLMLGAKVRAKKHKLPFDLDMEYLQKLGIPEICPVLGIPISIEAIDGFKTPNSPSIDKFYPELGYVKGNVQFISWKANNLKSDGSPEDWEKIAKWCKKKDIRMKLEGRHPDQQK